MQVPPVFRCHPRAISGLSIEYRALEGASELSDPDGCSDFIIQHQAPLAREARGGNDTMVHGTWHFVLRTDGPIDHAHLRSCPQVCQRRGDVRGCLSDGSVVPQRSSEGTAGTILAVMTRVQILLFPRDRPIS